MLYSISRDARWQAEAQETYGTSPPGSQNAEPHTRCRDGNVLVAEGGRHRVGVVDP